ncbi:uncharacterized protein OCT59_013061 [Rhizophagus irregularis]|uniref:uncharacterized protein n=1 Tax=Rhizophagus irregularis TaxID=588596 RepID=UPI00332766B2|nr:hypothetical protein OCT59_001686 [Rhizophagus irregularis]UZO20638.1 hypothetical protein OCT59_013061 [Rhizophagus irregularis]
MWLNAIFQVRKAIPTSNFRVSLEEPPLSSPSESLSLGIFSIKSLSKASSKISSSLDINSESLILVVIKFISGRKRLRGETREEEGR